MAAKIRSFATGLRPASMPRARRARAQRLPLLGEQRHQSEGGQRPDGEPGRGTGVLHQRVGQVGGVGGGEHQHARQGDRQQPQREPQPGVQHPAW